MGGNVFDVVLISLRRVVIGQCLPLRVLRGENTYAVAAGEGDCVGVLL